MKHVVIILTTISLAVGIKYNGLRVKFGWSDALADQQYFFKVPRTIHEVEGEEWRRTDGPQGLMQDLRMYCPPGRVVCPLYDTSGFIAGLQVAIPVNYIDAELKPERYFTKWSAPAAQGDPAGEYWTTTQYYVTEDALKAGAGPIVENGATLQDGGVWVKGLDGKTLKIPLTEAELKTTMFKKQNCIPNMGTHYYYNMTKQLDCNSMLPWFALVSRGDVLGVGLQTIGKVVNIPKQREWFEEVPNGNRKFPLLSAPHAPECYLDRFVTHGLISIHIYYIDEPWTIRCISGDSIEQAPVMERLALNGHRYINQIGDEFKKMING